MCTLSLALTPIPCLAAEFYSWIDSSGTMVMTDDPSRIPPPTQRSSVTIHRFQDIPPPARIQQSGEQRSSRRPEKPAGRLVPESQVEKDTSTLSLSPAQPGDLDPPPVLIQPPEERMRTQYVWIPLVVPVFVGPDAVSGFWSHLGVSSPIDAFNAFLRKQGIDYPGGSTRLLPGRLSDSIAPNAILHSGFVPYQQIQREREVLLQRLFPAPASPHPPAAGQARTGISRHP